MSESFDPRSGAQELQSRFSPTQLREELRWREAQLGKELRRREGESPSKAGPVAGLSDVDTDAIVEALLNPKVVYGPDERQDIYQVGNQNIVARAAGVVAIVLESGLTLKSDGTYDLTTIPLGQMRNLCPGQTFENQPAVPYPQGIGSGFFITSECIVTAGHCIKGNDLTKLRFIVGFVMEDANVAVTNFKAEQIFKAVSLVRKELAKDGADFAVVQVECLGTGFGYPLPLSTSPKVMEGEDVYVIGHPTMLPAKYAPGSYVRENDGKNYFIANLDTFGGNSGSPVFDGGNGVVGILVRGDTDYVMTSQQCWIANTCPDTGCAGESVQRGTGVAGLLKSISVTLKIGDNGIWSGRRVFIGFRDKLLTELPQTKFDPHRDYTFQLSPVKVGVSTIDMIQKVEVYSPGIENPISTDEWELAGLTLDVNGGQRLYSWPKINYTFTEDETMWQQGIVTVTGNPWRGIIVGGNSVYAVDPKTYDIYRYDGTPMQWSRIGGPGFMFVANDSALFRLKPDRKEVSQYSATGKKWKAIGGPSASLIAGGNSLYSISPVTKDIYRYDGTPMKWSKIGGPGYMFVANDSALYGISPNRDGIYRYSGTTWQKIGGPAQFLLAGGTYLFKIGSDTDTQDIYQYDEQTGEWNKIGGPGFMFAVNDSTLYGISPNRDGVYRYSGTTWQKIGGPAASVFAGGGGDFLYGVSPDSESIYRYDAASLEWTRIW